MWPWSPSRHPPSQTCAASTSSRQPSRWVGGCTLLGGGFWRGWRGGWADILRCMCPALLAPAAAVCPAHPLPPPPPFRQAPVVYFRAANPGVCTYMNDGRDTAVPHGACWYDMCQDCEVIDIPGDHFSILRQVQHRAVPCAVQSAVQHVPCLLACAWASPRAWAAAQCSAVRRHARRPAGVCAHASTLRSLRGVLSAAPSLSAPLPPCRTLAT
jgi:hypothetical protein